MSSDPLQYSLNALLMPICSAIYSPNHDMVTAGWAI